MEVRLPPDQKPEGDDVAWIPGYWAWDDERNDFLWVSGKALTACSAAKPEPVTSAIPFTYFWHDACAVCGRRHSLTRANTE